MQKNIDKIQSNLAELDARLKHEHGKFKTYNADMQEAEARCACSCIAQAFTRDTCDHQ